MYKKQFSNMLYGSTLLISMLLLRIFTTGRYTYLFLLWNLFLAFLPLGIAMVANKYSLKSWKLIFASAGWLLFFPNAPYLITDIYHIAQWKGVPAWYDALMLFTAACMGVGLAFTSLQIIERQWRFIWQKKIFSSLSAGNRLRMRMAAIMLLFLLTGFGIYLGRILRYNSWDLLTDSGDLLSDVTSRLLNPFEHVSTWGFTCIYGGVLFLLYQAWCGSSKINYNK